MVEHADQLRVLIATDNHLGVYEDDEIRKHDSFEAFEEILMHAHRLKVDALLLGGDLFHENKPSRPTVVRTIQLLRKYVMNDNPVHIQVLSDQEKNFSLNTRVNYEEDNYNVGLPIFIIHGNHDEPAGADNLSAIDILAACNLVNYYGKTGMSGAGAGKFKVDIAPVLIQKGDTRLALYGLGYMRDSRLYRMMTTRGDVTWRRPADAPGAPADSWFNLFFIHQNHAQRGAKNAVSEKQLPEWLDLVVWGHEHASKTEPTPSTEQPFEVSQPGSSVHTTLSEDEARPKKILLLSLKGADWRTETLPLRRVRPFVFENISLRDEPSLAARPDDADAVARFLHGAMEAAISRAHAQAAADADGGAGPLTGAATATAPATLGGGAAGAPPPAVLPLIRLRVDHSGGFPTVPLQRFGATFQGRVANPWDLLQFHKCAAKRTKVERPAGGAADAAAAHADGLAGGAGGEESEHRRIDALISDNLPATLQILAESDMALALEDFVQRDEKNALSDAVHVALAESQRKVAAQGMSTEAVDDPAAVMRAINVVMQEMKATKATKGKARGAAAPSAAASAAPGADDGAGPASAPPHWAADVDMMGDDAPAPAAKPRGKAAAPSKAKPKGGKQATLAGMFGRATASAATADGDEPASAPAARPARRAAATQKVYAEEDSDEDGGGAGGGDDASDDDFGAARAGARRGRAADSDDEDEDDDAIAEDEEEEELAPKKKKAAPAAARAAAKGKGKAAATPAAGAKRGRAAAEEPITLDDSDDDTAPKAKKAARAPPASLPSSMPPPSQQTGTTQGTKGWGARR